MLQQQKSILGLSSGEAGSCVYWTLTTVDNCSKRNGLKVVNNMSNAKTVLFGEGISCRIM
jgi:hypothetical protein